MLINFYVGVNLLEKRNRHSQHLYSGHSNKSNSRSKILKWIQKWSQHPIRLKDLEMIVAYGHLCYATGLLNTIVAECKWKKVPKKITAHKQVSALAIAIFESRELAQYARQSSSALEDLDVTRASKDYHSHKKKRTL